MRYSRQDKGLSQKWISYRAKVLTARQVSEEEEGAAEWEEKVLMENENMQQVFQG